MRYFLLTSFAIAIQLTAVCQPLQFRTGGGNLNNGLFNSTNIQYISILENSGAKMTRVNLYPYDYWDFVNNVPETNYADSLLLYLASKNIRVVLLFEHYVYFVSLGQPLGTYSKWQQIGSAFANRYKPGSAFFTSNGYPNYGIEYYTAINEPDIGLYMPKTIADGPENYHDALEGLADGVHSVDSSLKVIPGGFASENSAGSHTLNGFGTAIADLFNNGKLYGIDLHTYNDVSYAPILKWDNTNHVEFMAFHDFTQVKASCGITANIKFCATEFSFKENTQGINDTLAAKRLLTCIWGNLGAVLNDSVSSATEYALTWNLYNTLTVDPVYGMCITQTPYQPTLKGKTFKLVMDLSKDMDFTHLDPFNRGEYILQDTIKKMWVFQNYNMLSSIYGSTYTISQIPASTAYLQVYDWSGLRATIPNLNYSSYTFTNLNVNETYMFVATSDLTAGSFEPSNSIQPQVYPNPFEQFTTINPAGLSYKVYDAGCRLVASGTPSENNVIIGYDFLPGVYFIRFENGIVQKLIKY
ncbi:MAG: T9SS type A sorting domain-containing protein [Bacteroidetes bacterium]|nr:T9SS type A sorting domain-containing protein [Bacteroidota bacterium]